MTNKQYEHIGRALECAIRLTAASEAMDADRFKLANHLAAISSKEGAEGFVTKHFGRWMAAWNFPQKFFDAVGDAIAVKEKEVAR